MKELSRTRHALLETLAELSQIYPDSRFGQLVCMLSHVGSEPKVSDTYDIEDGAMLEQTLRLIAQSRIHGTTSYRLIPLSSNNEQ